MTHDLQAVSNNWQLHYLFTIEADNKESTKAPFYWSLWHVEKSALSITGDQWLKKINSAVNPFYA